MRIIRLLQLIVLSALLTGLTSGAASVAPRSTKIVGDYVEARTASVFAGACHFSGESVTTGRDAIMAWTITAGTWNGIDLAGASAMAAVSSQDNLLSETASRQSEIIINAVASAQQSAAMADFIQKQCGQHLGKVVSVRRATVTFDHTGTTYVASCDGFAAMKVQAMPNDECCREPNLVWYSPLVKLVHRKVGYTISSNYSAGLIGDPWERSEENTAFYGSFQF